MGMIATLTTNERKIGLGISMVVALIGLIMAASARQGAMAVHGGMALALGLALVFIIGAALYDQPEPQRNRSSRYYDAPVRFGIIMTLIWAVIGMSIGVWLAVLM